MENAVLVFAYEDGSPADVHVLSRDHCEQYWCTWQSRLQLFRSRFDEVDSVDGTCDDGVKEVGSEWHGKERDMERGQDPAGLSRTEDTQRTPGEEMIKKNRMFANNDQQNMLSTKRKEPVVKPGSESRGISTKAGYKNEERVVGNAATYTSKKIPDAEMQGSNLHVEHRDVENSTSFQEIGPCTDFSENDNSTSFQENGPCTDFSENDNHTSFQENDLDLDCSPNATYTSFQTADQKLQFDKNKTSNADKESNLQQTRQQFEEFTGIEDTDVAFASTFQHEGISEINGTIEPWLKGVNPFVSSNSFFTNSVKSHLPGYEADKDGIQTAVSQKITKKKLSVSIEDVEALSMALLDSENHKIIVSDSLLPELNIANFATWYLRRTVTSFKRSVADWILSFKFHE